MPLRSCTAPTSCAERARPVRPGPIRRAGAGGRVVDVAHAEDVTGDGLEARCGPATGLLAGGWLVHRPVGRVRRSGRMCGCPARDC
ncbi:hypothetical protein BIV02_07065 [Curtobacterium sp. MMLR14_014]|nr:hypothetical protein BIV02_07065 [Curtobacterium sp. MMLR14_014]